MNVILLRNEKNKPGCVFSVGGNPLPSPGQECVLAVLLVVKCGRRGGGLLLLLHAAHALHFRGLLLANYEGSPNEEQNVPSFFSILCTVPCLVPLFRHKLKKSQIKFEQKIKLCENKILM